jgi:hypothetical protein
MLNIASGTLVKHINTIFFLGIRAFNMLKEVKSYIFSMTFNFHYKIPMKPRYATRYEYDTDTPIHENFKKSISDIAAICYLKIKSKINYINAQYINRTKINNINNNNFF